MQIRFALDKGSVRTTDVDGHLHVGSSIISSAVVNPYLGSSIPDYVAHGLDPEKIYQLFRPPEELAKAASSFHGKPLLITHKPLTADDHDRQVVVGSVINPVWNDPNLTAELTVWDAEAIEGIEDESLHALSCGYRYEFDPSPGTYKGRRYDGVMRSLQGNHVSLVEAGRVQNAFVGDAALSPTPPQETVQMAKAAPYSRKALHTAGALRAYLTPKMAADHKMPDLKPILGDITAKNFKASKAKIAARLGVVTKGKLAADADISDVLELLDQLEEEVAEAIPDVAAPAVDDDDVDVDGMDDDAEMMAKVREILGPDADEEKCKALCALMAKPAAVDAEPKAIENLINPPAKDAEEVEGKKPEVTKSAMDAAISVATKAAVTRMTDARNAERIVRPWVGEIEVAMDSAEKVYRYALGNLGVDVTGVHASAFSAILQAQPLPGAAAPRHTTRVAMDAASTKEYATKFPNANRLA